jgi:hypothetical protein
MVDHRAPPSAVLAHGQQLSQPVVPRGQGSEEVLGEAVALGGSRKRHGRLLRGRLLGLAGLSRYAQVVTAAQLRACGHPQGAPYDDDCPPDNRLNLHHRVF